MALMGGSVNSNSGGMLASFLGGAANASPGGSALQLGMGGDFGTQANFSSG